MADDDTSLTPDSKLTRNKQRWAREGRLLTGRGRFVDDISLPGMLHAMVLRSPHAHAVIRGIDKTTALEMPGVHAVYTFADMPESLQKQTVPLLVPSPAIKQVYMQHCLARDEACYVGEPIAIVVADSRYLAEDAAGLVDIDYEVLSAASDCADALKPGALVHADATSNLAAFIPISVGDTILARAGLPF